VPKKTFNQKALPPLSDDAKWVNASIAVLIIRYSGIYLRKYLLLLLFLS